MTFADNHQASIDKEVQHDSRTSKLLVGIGYGVRYLITILIPFLLVLTATRLIMLPWFIQLEYQRPGFPEDTYGFSQEDRLLIAPIVLEYLFNDQDISFLDDLKFEDGTRFFNEDELQHMVDVKVVTQQVFKLLYLVWFTILIICGIMYQYAYLQPYVKSGLVQGGILTLGMIGAIIVVIGITWDTFFTSFHNLFFTPGTWQFSFSDTLIRLFPEQFWVDASLVVGSLTILFSLCLMFLMRYWRVEK